MTHQFILIPGRSSRQGVTLNEGKYTDGYLDETSTLRMHSADMQRLGISQGDDVRMWNDIGEVVVPCIDAKDECPEGLVFICYGDKSSQLMGGETHGTGMPDSKGLDVFVQPASEPRPASDAQPSGRVVTIPEPEDTPETTPDAPESASRPNATSPSPTLTSRQPVRQTGTNEIGPTLAMGLFVVALIVLAIVMNLAK